MSKDVEPLIGVFSQPVIALHHRGFLLGDYVGIGGLRPEAMAARGQLNKNMNLYLGQIVYLAASAAKLAVPKFVTKDRDKRSLDWTPYETPTTITGKVPSDDQIRQARENIAGIFQSPYENNTYGVLRTMAVDLGFVYPTEAIEFGPSLDPTLPFGPDAPIYVVDIPPPRRPRGDLNWRPT